MAADVKAVVNTDVRGLCSICGHVVAVMRNGHPRPHKQRRMRMSKAGRPEAYAAKVECEGLLHPAEPLVDGAVDDTPMPVEPMSAERWPSARELAAERFDLPKDVPHNGAGENS